MVHIIFVGGDSRQERAVRQLARKGALSGLDVVFFHPNWTRSWDKPLQAVKREIGTGSALVVTRDVPTELGHALRRLARELRVPWFGVVARGEAGVLHAVQIAAKSAA